MGETITNLLLAVILTVLILLTFFVHIIFIKLPKLNFHKRKRVNFLRRQDVLYSDYENFVYQFSFALKWMSERNIGALIVVENKDSLQQFINQGYQVEARFNPEFLISIFSNKCSALHDGGIIVREFFISSLSSYFPVTQKIVDSKWGARHRAAIGITEVTDALAFVVSETTGKVSYALKGENIEFEELDINFLSSKIFSLLSFYMN